MLWHLSPNLLLTLGGSVWSGLHFEITFDERWLYLLHLVIQTHIVIVKEHTYEKLFYMHCIPIVH